MARVNEAQIDRMVRAIIMYDIHGNDFRSNHRTVMDVLKLNIPSLDDKKASVIVTKRLHEI